MARIDQETFVCLDCETTGLDMKKDCIIEIAIARFNIGETLETFESLVDPQRAIPSVSTQIHHITDDMVIGKPIINKLLLKLLEMIGNDTIVGHGINFDIEMLAAACDRASIKHSLRANRKLDTLRMARLYGESPTNSLEQLRRHFNIEDEGAHRAMSDVIVNMEVFKQLAKDYNSIEHLFKELSKPIMLKTMPLGKHKGRPIKELPLQYLLWASRLDFDQDLLYSLRSEINRRKKGNLFSQATNPFADL